MRIKNSRRDSDGAADLGTESVKEIKFFTKLRTAVLLVRTCPRQACRG